MARTLLDKLSKKDQKSHVISNGINTEEFKTVSVGDFYKRFNIPEDKTKLLYNLPSKNLSSTRNAVNLFSSNLVINRCFYLN